VQDQQLNVRVTDDVVKKLDEQRVQLSSRLARIPSRSEVIRIALERYLDATNRAARAKKKQ
jgi:Arc/MetJ-type ribon-helix-helix transcriptional regulator